MHSHDNPSRRFRRRMAAVRAAEYAEHDVTIDGASIHYAAGPANGRPPLLLIHGQSTDWRSYAVVLPELARDFQVFAVDCLGHGRSARDPGRYSARAHGQLLAQFIETVIGRPAVVSGHSSGGLLAAWLAGNAPGWVDAVLLEDPPLFTTTLPRAATTWNFVDLATTCHGFLTSAEQDWVAYHWRHQRMWHFFGKAAPRLIRAGLSYHRRNPDRPIRLWFLPQLDEATRAIPAYDPHFGEAFFTTSWDSGFDLEASLRAIGVPATLVHTRVRHAADGILMAAMGDAEAARARSSIDRVEFVKADTGHDFHGADPKRFVDLLRELARRTEMERPWQQS
ncbi:alpha/beta hydrolase [Enemella evansiae]|uniref:alpha/beta fold hydrolase n=1 Tax=Enemella evansiae TaxID=2016499 RepID=UPI000B971755|nr:alpha/beta hydrolase [Enemella evansiae]OYN97362.1 alpha/beta hydrolase [Enemella evansiae]